MPAISTRPELEPVVTRIAATDSDCSQVMPPACSAAQTTSSPTPREALTSTTSPGCQQLRQQRRGLARVGDRMGLAVEAIGHRRGQRPDGDQHVDARLAGVRRRSRRGSSRSSGPSSSMSPSTATRRARRPRGGRGEVVEGGAHRHRVGVVAVVDQRSPRRAARTRCPRPGESASSTRPAGRDPDRPRGGHRGEQVRRRCACVNGTSSSISSPPASIRTRSLARRRAGPTSPPVAEGDGRQVIAQVRIEQRLAGRDDRGRARRQRRRSARPWPRRSPRSCPAARGGPARR